MDSISEMTVEVAYALPEKQTLLALQVPVNTTVMQAVERSGILAIHPEIDLARQKLGIFGRLAKPSEALLPGDRVEIYRPLKADPKEVRRRLAAEGKTMGRSDKTHESDSGDE
ncbi:MAG: RnfH family protein [Gammaproteobacteria bacterium]|nr:RnfH family protein [Gammaproteobacteria bacterium]